MTNRIMTKPIEAPSSAPVMRRVIFWRVCPTLSSAMTKQVVMQVSMFDQSLRFMKT